MDKGKFYDIIAIISLIIATIGAFVLPQLLIQPAIISRFELAPKEQIGNIIGGTTAPLIGLVTAVLMYIAFKAQYLANKKQWERIENDEKERKESRQVEMLWRLLVDIKEDFIRNELTETLNHFQSQKSVEKEFCMKTASKIKLLIHDIILLQSTLLDVKNVISEEYGRIFRYKFQGLWNIILEVYNYLPEVFKDDEIKNNFDRTISYHKRIEETFT
jgi:hypothetical protein